ncbi:uncharacterized protein LOC128858180 [Anastrepha ludens]|uniref:uncharacterized protein LOC128858180 n=1 Tax=Anastrepha ludens TaxID=28586 RepID=UPI0023B1F276|nr:uncharacterized protein LOC128858180 [Anastrepha ludens]
MDQRQKSKLSSLNDEDIATFLDLLEIDDDTDVEEDLEDLLYENVDDAELPIDTGIDEVINRAVNLSDSMLESEVCVNLCLVDHFNNRFQSIPMTQRLCDDEQMCAPKMRTFLRQYLPDKPHKWGIKLSFCVTPSDFVITSKYIAAQETMLF